MRKNYFFFLLFYSLSGNAFAQGWYPLDSGLRNEDNYPGGVSSIVTDTINHLLYAGGNFYYAGDTVSHNLAIWDGTKWSSVDAISEYLLYPVNGMYMLHDTLVFGSQDGVSMYRNHHFLQKTLFGFGSTVYSFCRYHDTLYGAGVADVEKWTGKKWKSIGEFGGQILPSVYSLCVYQDQLVVGGLFKSINDSAFNNIAAWDGNHWHKLGEGTVWSGSIYLGQVTCMTIYQNNLVAGGYFDSAGGVHAPWVAQWNGIQWSPMLGLCGNLWGVYADNIHGLYACGEFTKNIPYNCDAYGVAHWNGSSWDDLGIGSGGTGSCVTFFNNDLILGGVSFLAGMPINGIAGLKNGIATQVSGLSKSKFSIYPNPVTDELTVSFPFSNNIISIYDLFGREMKQLKVANGNLKLIDLSFLQQGVYVVVIKDEKGNVIAEEKLFME